jgi:hypothetical protein
MRTRFQRLSMLALGAYVLASLPLAILFAVNHQFRHVFFNLSSHYRAKLVKPHTVHVGDSITAGGGHWSFLLSSMPFDSINLAGDGYTTRQIAGQVRRALLYQPKVVVIMAGANDILGGDFREQEVVDGYIYIAKLFAGKPSQCLVTLPTKLRDPSQTETVELLNGRLSDILPEMGCLVVDLNPDLAPNGVLERRFTRDGIHLNQEAYAVWADRLRPLLPK